MSQFLVQNLKLGNYNFLFITFLDYAIPSYYYKNKNGIFCENKVALHRDKSIYQAWRYITTGLRTW